jgi:uncharacterized membrane protein
MHWLLGVLGAFLGAMFAEFDRGFFGMLAGALIGWHIGRGSELKRRVAALERAQSDVAPPATARAVVSPTAPVAAPPSTPVPVAEPPLRADAEVAEGRAVFTAREPAVDAAEIARRATEAARAAEAADEIPASERIPPPIEARPTAAPAPAAPRGPDLGERLAGFLKRALFEGNVPVKLGMLVLFFGVAAGIKYAVDQGWVSLPIELRLAGFAALALAALVWGWRNREVRPAFGLSLQGGAIGMLLLVVFGAFRIWGLVPAGIAFALVVVLVIGAALLAVLQDSIWLALLGFIGGYLAPVLISTGSGNHVALFSYYAVLNLAVFGIAWVRQWRALNLVGFAFTFIVGTMWGAKYYRPELFATVEPFLILFFLFYVAIAVLYALRDPDGRRGLVDGTLVFGTPLLAFPLQAALMGEDRMGLAYSALAVALLYVLLAVWLIRRRGATLLGQSFAALAVGFATLAVPLALSARWTSASWALEGAALVWLGLRQRRLLPQFAGWALQALAGLAYLVALLDGGGWLAAPEELPVLNGHALGVGLMALSAFFLAWLHERAGGHRLLVWLGFVLGSGWWLLAGVREVVEHFEATGFTFGLVGFAALTATLAALLRGTIPWARLGWLVLAVAASGPLLVLLTEMEHDGAITLRANAWWLAWFGALLFGLARLREPAQRGLSIAHVLVLATAAWLYGNALHESASRLLLDDGWRFVAGLLPLLALLFLTWRAPRLGAFPLADAFPRYRMRWFAPACAVLGIAWLTALAERGGAYPLPFVPLLNPVELFQLGLLLVAIQFARQHGALADPWRPPLAIAAFLFVTFAGLRAVHHYTGAPWNPNILDDRIAQAVLTVLWSMLGVAAWIYGSRRRLWNVWLSGAILMGIVLAKLVLLDRQYVGNLAGIVSFMAVGALLVLVGRIAPTPPRARADTSTAPEGQG